jgi:hypothetical protein
MSADSGSVPPQPEANRATTVPVTPSLALTLACKRGGVDRCDGQAKVAGRRFLSGETWSEAWI